MSVEIKVPVLPESVQDATVAAWHKKVGDFVKRDENLLDLETDKVVLEVPAPADGILSSITCDEGKIVTTGEILAVIDENAAANANEKHTTTSITKNATTTKNDASNNEIANNNDQYSPSVRRLASEQDVDLQNIAGTGKNNRVTKEDVQTAIANDKTQNVQPQQTTNTSFDNVDRDTRVPMTRLRKRVAERLIDVQHNAAILSSFNEIDLSKVIAIRKKYKDLFADAKGTKLGFMSFFVKAAVAALKQYPIINASVDDSDIIYHNYYDIGVAVASPKGLVVPVLRDVNNLSMADIETNIVSLGQKAAKSQLTIDELTGGTFTITNGGVFGSLLSTPIINPPQSAILGMHNIVERPIAEDGKVVIRPMMYIALSYDHRIIDGKEAVLFLKHIKQSLEDPARLLLEI